jgi:prenyltransferase beta subunit
MSIFVVFQNVTKDKEELAAWIVKVQSVTGIAESLAWGTSDNQIWYRDVPLTPAVDIAKLDRLWVVLLCDLDSILVNL